jgi:hypothetical protein
MTVTLACGCVLKLSDTDGPPVCPTHQERRVSRVVARAPKFRGVCQGPHAVYESLPGMPVTVGVQDG